MRKTLLMTVAAVFALTSAGLAPVIAGAQPTPHQMKKAGEIKNPVKADAAVAKLEAKDAKKQAHRARKDAKRARRKAHAAAKHAAKAENTPPNGGQ